MYVCMYVCMYDVCMSTHGKRMEPLNFCTWEAPSKIINVLNSFSKRKFLFRKGLRKLFFKEFCIFEHNSYLCLSNKWSDRSVGSVFIIILKKITRNKAWNFDIGGVETWPFLYCLIWGFCIFWIYLSKLSIILWNIKIINQLSSWIYIWFNLNPKLIWSTST